MAVYCSDRDRSTHLIVGGATVLEAGPSPLEVLTGVSENVAYRVTLSATTYHRWRRRPGNVEMLDTPQSKEKSRDFWGPIGDVFFSNSMQWTGTTIWLGVTVYSHGLAQHARQPEMVSTVFAVQDWFTDPFADATKTSSPSVSLQPLSSSHSLTAYAYPDRSSPVYEMSASQPISYEVLCEGGCCCDELLPTSQRILAKLCSIR